MKRVFLVDVLQCELCGGAMKIIAAIHSSNTARDPLEGRGEQTNGSDEGNMTVLRDRTTMSPEHIRIAELAKEDRDRRFSSIAHLLTDDALHDAFEGLRKDASAGVDGKTHKLSEYAASPVLVVVFTCNHGPIA